MHLNIYPEADDRARERGGVLFRVLFFLCVVFAFASLLWMLFLPAFITSQIRARTGFDTNVVSLSVNPFTGVALVRGFVVNNPADFPVRDFILVREFSCDLEMWTLLTHDIIFAEVTLDIAKVELVQRRGQEGNIELFEERLAGRSPSPRSGSADAHAISSPRPLSTVAVRAPVRPNPEDKTYMTRKLILRFDQLVVAQYTDPDQPPVIKEYDLHLRQTYMNFSDPKQLLVPAVLRGLAAAHADFRVGDLVSGDFDRALGNFARDAASNGREAIKGAGKKTTETVKGLIDKLEDSRKP